MLKRVSNYLALAVVGLGAALTAGWSLPASAAPGASTTLTSVVDVSCASTSHCWASGSDTKGSAIIGTTDGGARWSVQYTTTKLDAIVGIDCTSVSHCVAVGDTGTGSGSGVTFLETTDGGKVWGTHAAPRSLVIAEAVSCANGSDCWAIGLAGNRIDAAVAHTTDGGRFWSAQSIPSLETAMSNSFGISCASSTRCLATGDAALTTTDGGKAWTKHSVPHGVPFGPITCPSTTDCYAIEDVTSAIPANEQTFVYTSTNGGATWRSALADPKRVAGLGDISCPSTSTCVAVGSGYTPRPNGNYTLFAVSESTATSGKRWAEVKVTKAQYLTDDSCVAGTTDCVAVGSLSGNVGAILKSTNDGATWTAEPLPKV